MKKYSPTDGLTSPRFSQIRTFARLPHVSSMEDVDIAIVGVPFDTGATYRAGARQGPAAIRDQSAIIRQYNYGIDVRVYEYCSCVDFGDLEVIPGYMEASFDKITEQASPFFEAGVVPIFMGGDHSVSFPLLRAAHKHHGPVALVHFDSHTDLYPKYWGAYETHGTPFRMAVEQGLLDTARSIQIGLRGSGYSSDGWADVRRYGLDYISAAEMLQIGMTETVQRIRERVGEGPTYLTFDIDFVDPAFAPGTGTPEVGGPSSAQVLELIRGLKGMPFVGYDLVEVLPSFDPAHITALLAANVMFEFMSLTAVVKRAAEHRT